MRNLKKFIVIYWPIAFIILIGILSITWFRGDFLIYTSDSYLPLNTLKDFQNYIYSAWLHFDSTGLSSPQTVAGLPYHVFFVLLKLLGIPLVLSQKILYYFLFSLCGISMYYLATVVMNKNRKIVGLSSALFYMFNFFPLFSFWRPGIASIFFYATTPLILGLYIKLLNTRKIQYIVFLFIILCTITVITFVNPVNLIVLFLILSLYLLFHIFQKLKTRLEIFTDFIYSTLLLFLWLFLNIWWILPMIFSMKEGIASASAIGGTIEVFKLTSSQTSFLNLFRLLGYWPFNSISPAGDPYFSWAWIYSTPIFLILGFIPPILAFIPFLLKKKNKIIFFLGPLLLSSLFLMKGLHSPLGEINKWIFLNVPFFEIFRNQYEKFGILVVLPMAILVGMGFGIVYYYLKKYSRWIAQISTVVLFILLFGVYMWPYWTGDIIYGGDHKNPSARVKVPDYYYEAGKWTQEQQEEFKILSLPHQEGTAYSWECGYAGSGDPTLHFLQRPLLSRTINTGTIIDPYLSNLFNVFNKDKIDENISSILGLTNVRYILVHNDINYFINTPNPDINAEYIKSILSSQKGINFEKSFGELDFYRTSDQYFLPHFYTPQNVIIPNQTVDGLPQIVSQPNYKIRSAIYSEQELKVESEKLKDIEQYNFRRIIVLETKLDKIEKLEKEIKKINETIVNLEAKDFKKLSKKDKLLLSKSGEEKQGLEQEKKKLLGDSSQYFAEVKDSDNYDFSFRLPFCQQEKPLLLNNIPLITINSIDYDIPYEIIKAKENSEGVEKYRIKTDDDCFVNMKDIELNQGELKIAANYILGLNNLIFSRDYPKEIDLPVLEFKKVNPTKYIVRVHQAKDSFPLVFSESFHNGWKAYLAKPNTSSKFKVQSSKLSEYKILDGNEEDQASKEELMEYINNGWVMDLGNGKGKKIEHKKYENGKEVLDYVEKYNIDFISKNFQDTIQNDNLPGGRFYETWLKKSLPEENHLMVNGYANSWWVDINQIKSNIKNYVENPDGSIDFELVVEFWPQRLFYIGLFISGITLLGCLGYIGYDWRKRRRRKILI